MDRFNSDWSMSVYQGPYYGMLVSSSDKVSNQMDRFSSDWSRSVYQGPYYGMLVSFIWQCLWLDGQVQQWLIKVCLPRLLPQNVSQFHLKTSLIRWTGSAMTDQGLSTKAPTTECWAVSSDNVSDQMDRFSNDWSRSVYQGPYYGMLGSSSDKVSDQMDRFNSDWSRSVYQGPYYGMLVSFIWQCLWSDGQVQQWLIKVCLPRPLLWNVSQFHLTKSKIRWIGPSVTDQGLSTNAHILWKVSQFHLTKSLIRWTGSAVTDIGLSTKAPTMEC